MMFSYYSVIVAVSLWAIQVIPVIGNGSFGNISARDLSDVVASRNLELAPRASDRQLRIYRGSLEQVEGICNTVSSTEQLSCQHKLQDVKDSKVNHSDKLMNLESIKTEFTHSVITRSYQDESAIVARASPKTYARYRKALHRLTMACTQAKGAQKSLACHREMKSIQDSKLDHHVKIHHINQAISKFHPSTNKKAEARMMYKYEKQLAHLREACVEVTGSARDMCFKELIKMSKSKGDSRQKLTDVSKAVFKFEDIAFQEFFL